MKNMPDNFVDLIVTSPPYDNLRSYNGYTFDFESIAKELFRVTKEGGVIVWIVQDATIKGSKTGTSFKQVLYFKELGFNLNDTMIWDKGSFTAVGSLTVRYGPSFEYMFILSKGKPKTFNPIKDRKNKHSGKTSKHIMKRQIDGTMKKENKKNYKIGEYGIRFNVWQFPKFSGRSTHPAVFPKKLVIDHIISWSNEGDTIYDPFMGSGTTALACKDTKRNYLGSEISKKYFEDFSL